MKNLILLLFISTNLIAQSVPLKGSVHKKVKFISHTEDGRFGTYLQMNINFEPIEKFFNYLDELVYLRRDRRLSVENAREEAHITVITPIEYRDQLEKAGLTINRINEIANKIMKIQESDFEVVCLAEGIGKKGTLRPGIRDFTYYFVVKSRALMKIRKAIEVELRKKKYKRIKEKFNPYSFHPHITIGYTHKDLHLEHGVIKSPMTCIADVREK